METMRFEVLRCLAIQVALQMRVFGAKNYKDNLLI